MAVLDGKVALITGASSGIGAATARVLAAQGAAVALGARRTDRLDELVAELHGTGARALALELDVTSETSCRAGVDTAVREFGGLDIVVNNAGVMLLGPIVDADTSDWRRSIETNVLGLMYVTHAALPHLMDKSDGQVGDIVNMSSVAGRSASSGSGVYNASKWAVNAFSESLRQELVGRGVRVSLVEPGAVATELTDHITHPGAKEAAEGFYNSMRNLESDDIAQAVVYIVSQPAHVALNEILIRPTEQR
jgi:NADP-dependent 3-hydroxy acid dehydrogenase YdfG